MHLETDPKKIEKLAARQEDADRRFRSFLKDIDLASEEVDAVGHRLYNWVAEQIDCLSCANCCRETLPTLREEDVARLSGAPAISREEDRETIPGSGGRRGDIHLPGHALPVSLGEPVYRLRVPAG